MGDISLTATKIRALQANGAVVRSYDAGEDLTVGNVVYVASDGDVEKAQATAQASAKGFGVVVESYDGETSISDGDRCSVCVFGPVSGFSSMTPGDTIYVSDTEGKLADEAGTYSHVMGRAERAGVLWVDPAQADPSS